MTVAVCRVVSVSWDIRIDGDLVCAQAKYHARSIKTFVFSSLRLSLLPPIALCCWILAHRSFRMRLKKMCQQHWSNPSRHFTLHVTCGISVIVSVCMHVPFNPMPVVAPHNLPHVGHCFRVHACDSQSMNVFSPFLIQWHLSCGQIVCIWDRLRRLADFFQRLH